MKPKLILRMAILVLLGVCALINPVPKALALDFPVANFSAEPTSGTAPVTVHFTDLSTGATAWGWKFHGSSQTYTDSTEQNPTYTYQGPGTYSVSLYVSGPTGEAQTEKKNLIQVLAPPPPPPSYTRKWSLPIAGIGDASPAVDSEGTIYVSAGSPGKLYAVNPEGSVKWTYDIGGRLSPSPVIDGDTIYIASNNGSLYAVYNSGNLKWQWPFPEGQYDDAVPAVGSDGSVCVAVGQYLYVVNPDGTVKWGRSSLGGFGNPVMDSSGKVYVMDRRQSPAPDPGTYFVAFGQNGEQVWKTKLDDDTDTIVSFPALGEKYIFLPTSAYPPPPILYALDYGGNIVWKAPQDNRLISGVVVGNGIVYTGSRAISAIDGRLVWAYDLGASDDYSFGVPCLGDDGSVYVLHNKAEFEIGYTSGSLRAVNPDGTRRWTIPLGRYAGTSAPVIRGGTLYVASWEEGALHAIDVESDSLAATDWPCMGRNLGHTGRYDHLEPPVPVVSANVRQGKFPLNVRFSAGGSLHAVSNWLWDFGDGETSTEANPVHTYNDAAQFTVSLSVTGPAGSNAVVEPDFITVLPAIKVLRPGKVYEEWKGGTWQPLRWTSAGVTGPVKISLYQRILPTGGKWTTISENEVNDGYRPWLVCGMFGKSGFHSKIKVESKDNPSIFDQSRETFIPLLGAKMVSPNGGEVWPVGAKRVIRWGAVVTGSSVHIDLSRDGGQTWKRLFTNTPNDGQQLWTVTGPATARARIRIMDVRQHDGSFIYDKSDGNFTIRR